MIKNYLFLLLCFSVTWGFSQNPKPSDYGIKSKKALGIYLEGMQNDQWRDRKKAVELYKEAISMEPNFGDAYYRCAADLYFLKEYEEALPFLEKALELVEDPNVMIYFFAGELYFYNTQYPEARENYQKLLNENPRIKKNLLLMAEKNLDNAVFAEKAIKIKTIYDPVNLGDNINSIGHEYLPYLTADEEVLFFTARRPECEGGYKAELGDFPEDFFYSEKKDGKWGRLQSLGPPVNTDKNEGAASFSPDGQYVYYTGCNRMDGLGSCDLYVSRLEGRTWTKPQNLGAMVNSEFWDSQPCISNDGKTLFFSSNRPGGLGANDIWYSRKVNDKWGEAKLLPGPINTEGYEYSPFLHADGKTFYFSSDGHPGFGGIDLFVTRMKDGVWSRPENLGYPLNSMADERNIFVNAKGNLGFINSDGKGGFGGYDLYQFELDERIKPDFATFVRGKVINQETRKPLEANVILIDLERGDTIREVVSNSSTGKFLASIPLEREYAAFIQKKGFLFKSENFSLKNLDKQLYFDIEIELEPIKEGARIVLKNIFYETGKFALLNSSKSELEQIVNFMKQNPKVKIEISGHTDNVGSEDFNKTLSENRAGSVKEHLVEQGIPETRIISKGYGETMPLVSNDTEEGKAQNRRTEFKIVGM